MRRNRGNSIYLLLLFAVLLLAGCSSKKQIARSSVADDGAALSGLVAESPSMRTGHSSISANTRLSVDIDGKTVSAGGTLRIKKGEGVQLGITAFGLMEVACLEFLPENVRVINKVGKEYSELPYADVAFLQKTGIDYGLFESLFLNRMFSPDGRPVAECLNTMDIEAVGDSVRVSTKEHKGVVYHFLFDKLTANLVRSEGVYHNGAKVVCSYQDFEELDSVPFPRTMSLSLEGAGKNLSLLLKMSKVSASEFDFSPRKVSSGYKREEALDLLKSLE